MTKRPSQRMQELLNEAPQHLKDRINVQPEMALALTVDALVQYLDEEWEKGRCGRGEHFPAATKEGVECGKCRVAIGKRS